jgi:hypothetical protein
MSLTGNAESKYTIRGNISALDKIHGYSAYEIAVIHGFEGTEEEWLESLHGDGAVINDLTTGGTTDALSAEMGKVLGQKPNPNILHNWHFVNPVNTRGMQQYTGAVYTIDRWKGRGASLTAELTANGLKISNTSATSAAFLAQYLDGNLPDGEYTLSILVTEFSGEPRCALYTPSGNIGNRLMLTDTGLFSIQQIVSADKAFNSAQIGLPSGASVTIAAIKLEIGNTQTLAHLDGGKWVLNEIPDKAQEAIRCGMSHADISDLCANNYSNVVAEPEYLLMSQPEYADEMVAVAKSYFEKDNAYFNETGNRYFSYNSDYTCMSGNFGNAAAEGLNKIDCSVFVGLVLRGIPFSKSPYSLPFSERAKFDRNSIKANIGDYRWAVNPFEWQTSKAKNDTPDQYDEPEYKIRTASQLAEWMTSLGCSFVFARDFSNVEPGDIIFYVSFASDTEYKWAHRYKHISHVAICATKEIAEEGFGYPYKHQIYDATGVDGGRTFFYEDDGNGSIKSTRYLEDSNPELVAIVCRPRSLQHEKDSGVALARIGATGRRNLLDNWYMLDPVNQKGMTEYTGYLYGIDRWKCTPSTDTKFTIGEHGVTIANIGSSNAFYYQPLEKPLPAGEYTLSVLVTGYTPGSGSSGISFNFNNGSNVLNNNRNYINGVGLFSVTLALTDADGCNNIRGTLTPGAAVTIAAVKLERGNGQTLAYQDAQGNWIINDVPDKAQELWKCQRYFQLFSSEDKRPTDKRDFRPELVNKPSNVGTIVVDGKTYYYANANL